MSVHLELAKLPVYVQIGLLTEQEALLLTQDWPDLSRAPEDLLLRLYLYQTRLKTLH